jgi:hypothetical protein
VTNTEHMFAVAIGVANAEPLPYLGAALNGAGEFYAWATALGYRSILVTDEDVPLTMDRLRDELKALLGDRAVAAHRLAIYFAGHGLIREAEETLWLLSDWHTDMRAVAVEPLKRRLFMYDIQQIAIFSDACRLLPSALDIGDITADAVLGRGPRRPTSVPPIDKFIATQDGAAAYAIPGATEELDRCLFTGVLMEGLWGIKPTAFSKIEKEKVTSRSLGHFLELEVPRVAMMYQRTLNPQVSPTFPEGEDVYFLAGVSVTAPAFPDWPSPERVGNLPVAPDDREPSEAVDASRLGLGSRESQGAMDSRRTHRLLAGLRDDTESRFNTQCGITIVGARAVHLWTPQDIVAERIEQSESWEIRAQDDGSAVTRSVPLLVEFQDGRFAAIAALPQFVARLVCDERGVSGLLYRKQDMPLDTTAATTEAIEYMERGSLRFDAVVNLTVKLREWKHVDPVLGVISAYLYDSIGDIDSIRRMAHFYAAIGQHIPYDVALLAQIEGSFQGGELHVKVPAVARRDPRTPEEKQHSWAYLETPETQGPVGGLWPWMRQGWPFLDDLTDDESTLVLPDLREAARHMTPGRFCTLTGQGAEALVRGFDLVAHEVSTLRPALQYVEVPKLTSES